MSRFTKLMGPLIAATMLSGGAYNDSSLNSTSTYVRPEPTDREKEIAKDCEEVRIAKAIAKRQRRAAKRKH